MDNEWIEWLRARLWPACHAVFGEYWYFESLAGENQYVGTVEMTEDEIESVLRGLGFSRNPIAAFKSRRWGADSTPASEGSWAWREGDSLWQRWRAPMQVHVTLFSNDDGSYDILAHYEANWKSRPTAHYRSTDFHPEAGADMVRNRLRSVNVHPYNAYE